MTCTPGIPYSCSASFTVSAGPHNFNAEVYDTTHNKILAEGQDANQSVSAGNGNSVTITLAGVATNVVFPMGTCGGSTCWGAAGSSSTGVAVTDFDSANITSIPTYFDDGTLTITGVTESPYNGSCGSCDDDTVTIAGRQ